MRRLHRSQSPQIGSMFLTMRRMVAIKTSYKSQSPQIGSMFLTWPDAEKPASKRIIVAIPSNRVNVSYVYLILTTKTLLSCRNPLKSGQCFLPVSEVLDESGISQSQSPQIGSMFLT